uniref:PNPLA domain-containing protein n=1 Tax=Globisporangium ultimum (strain ATCC 200006 / CBS 805.95 / DAOM BR144) TaxID=431595 RepID=K3WU72_GLOUD
MVMCAEAAMTRTLSVASLVSPQGGRAAWKDTDRIAQFVANVAGGIFVVTGVCGYLINLAATSRFELPDVNALLEHALQSVMRKPSFVHPCWSQSNVSDMLMECWSVVHKIHYETGSLAELRVFAQVMAAIGLVLVGVFALRKYKWIGWFLCLQFVTILQWFVALYQVVRIALSMSVYFFVKFTKFVLLSSKRVYVRLFGMKNKYAEALRQLMKAAKTYTEWFHMAKYLDVLEEKENWKNKIRPEDMDLCDFHQLKANMDNLKRAIAGGNIEELKYITAAFAMRNKLGIDSPGLHLECNSGTKTVIEEYDALAVRALEILANATPEEFPTAEKQSFFKIIKQSFGSTALCLSGGGAIAMYHMGVIKALLEADLLPNVISGSSGGSISAAMAACKTNEELLNDILQNNISTRYIPMGIRWFPPLMEQLAHCVKTGFLVECSAFERTTQHYFGEPMNAEEKIMHYTFQDAYLKTGRHVCITVSASDVTGHKGPKKLLLNHINSPHVLLWSAVAVSCSLPGIMKGKQLMARDFEGNIVPYISLGKEWVDGSIQHDLPMETMASCFNVTNFIVSQVNPHVVPFVGDDVDTPNFRKSMFHTLESVIAADVRHRLKMLAFLGLFPKIYGHQFSSYFKQNFSGNVTLIPDFIFLEAIGIKAILNPTVDDMNRYIEGGQRCVWPKLQYIRHLCTIEKALDKILAELLGNEVVPYCNWLQPTTKVDPETIVL